MGSDKKRTSSDAEYQYASEDLGEESLQQAPQKPALTLRALKEKLLERLPKKKKYRVLLFLGLAAYVLYQFMDVGTPPAKTSMPTPQKIIAQPLAQPSSPSSSEEKKQPEAAVKKVEKPAAVVSSSEAVSSMPKVDMGAETDQASNAQIKELQASLEQVNRSVSMLESSLFSLTNSVIRLSDKINLLEESHFENARISKLKQSIFPVYHVQSLVAGRAWVSSSAGNFTTVKVGDSLPGYGEIENIDVRAGTISTSSGRVISYGPNDH